MFNEFGERYQDNEGNTYIVVEPREGDRGYALLLEDFDILANPEGFAWAESLISEEHIEQPVRIEDNPEMTSIVRQRAEEEKTREEIWKRVPADKHREFYNALHDAKKCSARIAAAQEEVNQYSGIRARALQKMVDIVGSQPPVARLLGMNQSTLSRALRPRDNA
jgi:hypothetical protein